MKKLIPLAAILGATLSLGTTFALADGGETGSDASHTSSYWTDEGTGSYTQQGQTWRAPQSRYDRNARVRGY